MLGGNTHVEVQAGSAFPQSKAMKQAQIKDWMTFFMESGNPPKGRQLAQFLRDSGMGASDRLVQEYSDNEQQINRENARMAQGIPVNINSYDDDDEHVEGHTAFQKQPKYQTLPQQVQQMIELHVGAHRERLQQIQQQQLEQQMQLAGQVPPALSAAALQETHELSQLQGQQQMAQQGAQAQQQQQGVAQQQGYQAAGQEQQQRQAEELHQHKLSQLQEQHQQRMQHAQEQHEARLRQS